MSLSRPQTSDAQQPIRRDQEGHSSQAEVASIQRYVNVLTVESTWEPGQCAVMWPVMWTALRTYAPYVTFPVAFVVGAVGYHLEWFIRGTPKPREEEKSILELREERKLQEQVGMDSTQVLSLKEKLEFAPKAALNRNRPEKS